MIYIHLVPTIAEIKLAYKMPVVGDFTVACNLLLLLSIILFPTIRRCINAKCCWTAVYVEHWSPLKNNIRRGHDKYAHVVCASNDS